MDSESMFALLSQGTELMWRGAMTEAGRKALSSVLEHAATVLRSRGQEAAASKLEEQSQMEKPSTEALHELLQRLSPQDLKIISRHVEALEAEIAKTTQTRGDTYMTKVKAETIENTVIANMINKNEPS